MLKFKKVYIDSYYRASGTSSDFTIDLPETVQLEDNMLCQIHEVSIPHSWYSINETNNNFYVMEGILPPATPSGVIYRKLIIPVGNYTASELATQLETSLNTLDSGDRTNSFSVSYSSFSNKIEISSNYPEVIYTVLTDNDVLQDTQRFVETVDGNNLNSINRVLGVYTTAGDASTNVVPYLTGFIDLSPAKNLYLHCNEISNFNQLTVAGNSSIVKKIPVNVSYLGVINDNELSNFDYIDVSGKMLRRLHFRISDQFNKVVNLNDVDVSFTLTFFRG